jgi:pyrroloquinoline quinone biosynthesis protein D
MFLPDEPAVEILKLVDGARCLGVIIDDLAVRFDAPRAQIAGDVVTMLHDLADKGVVRW